MSKTKQYFYTIILIFLTNIYLTTSKETYVGNTTVTANNSETNNNKSIPSEGGGKIILSTSTSTPTATSTSTSTTIKPIVLNNTKTTITSTSSTSTPEIVKPVSEPEEIVGDSKVKARKGVTFSEASTTTTTTTSTTTTSTTTTSTTTTTTKKPTTVKVFIPHKPTVTISNDDDIQAKSPPKLFINGKELLPKNHTNPSSTKLVTDDSNNKNKIYIGRRTDNGPDYVLPIVLTILSVPLLAIIFTVVYKRGAEWWHHRHYRRMDFLIDGMYNN